MLLWPIGTHLADNLSIAKWLVKIKAAWVTLYAYGFPISRALNLRCVAILNRRPESLITLVLVQLQRSSINHFFTINIDSAEFEASWTHAMIRNVHTYEWRNDKNKFVLATLQRIWLLFSSKSRNPDVKNNFIRVLFWIRFTYLVVSCWSSSCSTSYFVSS